MNLIRKLDKTIKETYRENNSNDKAKLLEQVNKKIPSLETYVISKRIDLFFKSFGLN